MEQARPRFSAELVAPVVRIYGELKSVKLTAEAIHRSTSHIRRILAFAGVQTRPPVINVYPVDKVEEIVSLLSLG